MDASPQENATPRTIGPALLASEKDSLQSDDTVGTRLRRRRKAKRMTLKEVSIAAGLSESYVSHLERGRVSGSIASLQKITTALGMTVGDLFTEPASSATHVVRIKESAGYAIGTGVRKMRLTPLSNEYQEVFAGELEPGGTTGPEAYSHGDSEETLILLEGEVIVEVDGEQFQVGKLESISYQSRSPHMVTASLDGPAQLLWIIAPPSY